MELGLGGRAVVITGGASGIGAATAQVFLNEGARVSIWDISGPSGDSSDRTHRMRVDVTKLAEVEWAWQETERALGPVDILVHAAAIGSGQFGFPYTEVPASAWPRVLEVNIMGMTHVAHVAGPAMQGRRRGAMVFVASIAGQMGSQTDPPYSASKAANINFAQCMARDLAPHGVRVNTVCPGMVETPLNRSVWQAWHDRQPADARQSYHAWAEEKIRRVVPLQRWQKPQDIADMIVFLCSDRAGEVTGQTINVDGGCVMHS